MPRERNGAQPDSAGTLLLTPRLIGDVNRSRIIRALCDHGPLSRADLARLAGVPRATIGAIVQGLMEDGVLEEGRPAPPPGRVGKPARPLWFQRQAGRSLAISLTDGMLRAAVVNARGEVLAREEHELGKAATDRRALGRLLRQAVQALAAGEILGVGVAVPGVCDTARGVVVGSGQVPAAEGAFLTETLTAITEAPVHVDNDARALALAEKWFGQGRGLDSFAVVQTGAGLGVGLVLDGTVFRGHHGLTGELGHTVVDADGTACRCGLRGCWETVATLPWLRAAAADAGLAGASTMDAATLNALAEHDAPAARLQERYAAHLALGLANLVQVLAPSLVVLHGDVTGGGEALLALVREHTWARVLPHLRVRTELALSTLGADAPLLGAAGFVLSDTFRLAP